MDVGGTFMETVNSMKDITLFAPSNEAWNDPGVQNIMRDKAKMRDILNMHIVRDRMNIERIRQGTQNSVKTQVKMPFFSFILWFIDFHGWFSCNFCYRFPNCRLLSMDEVCFSMCSQIAMAIKR